MNVLPSSFPFFKEKYEAAWVQFDCTGGLCLRIITLEMECPSALGDGMPLLVKQRVSATDDFPIWVWEAALPSRTNILEIEDVQVSLPSSFTKIAFTGDTGCRPNQKTHVKEWPFHEISKKILADQPDVIIHLGDYIYRHLHAQEKLSPDGIHGDEGDNWLGWYKEFFKPLSDILLRAPWVFVRGNQENPPGASEGWRRFLDGYPYHEEETNYDPPYVIRLDKVNLIVHDTSGISSHQNESCPHKQLEGLILPKSNPVWLLTHQPLWGIVNNQKDNEDASFIMFNEHGNLQRFLEPFPENLTTIFSGHIHAFQAIKLREYPIYQFVIGNGGVSLEEDAPPEVLKNTRLEDQKIEEALSLIIFGYGLAQYVNGEWALSLKDVKGNIIDTFMCIPHPSLSILP